LKTCCKRYRKDEMVLFVEKLREPLALSLTKPREGVALYWLGQAGFALTWRNFRWLIDPYLSDSLARKYAGKEFSHVRMMPCPIGPEAFPPLHFVLCTHRHGDHMDPDTLPQIARHHPHCRFVVPAAEVDYAGSLGLPKNRLIGAQADHEITLAQDFIVFPLPAAHEHLKQDANGQHHFLGYLLKTGNHLIYHSGDSVLYDGLEERLQAFRCHLALLPVQWAYRISEQPRRAGQLYPSRSRRALSSRGYPGFDRTPLRHVCVQHAGAYPHRPNREVPC
jgi:L-ascorbate metabolism protein UlaG (beta-lactamase superfamily)